MKCCGHGHAVVRWAWLCKYWLNCCSVFVAFDGVPCLVSVRWPWKPMTLVTVERDVFPCFVVPSGGFEGLILFYCWTIVMNVVRSVLLFLWWCWPVTCLKMQMEHLICWSSWFASLISHPNFPSNCPNGLPDGLLPRPVWSRLQGNSLTIFWPLWGAGGSDPICEILPNLRDLFQDLNGNIICNRYLKH